MKKGSIDQFRKVYIGYSNIRTYTMETRSISYSEALIPKNATPLTVIMAPQIDGHTLERLVWTLEPKDVPKWLRNDERDGQEDGD